MGGGSSTIQDPVLAAKLRDQAEDAMKHGRLTRDDFGYLADPQPRVWADILFKVLMDKADSTTVPTDLARLWLETALNSKINDDVWKESIADGESGALATDIDRDEFVHLACTLDRGNPNSPRLAVAAVAAPSPNQQSLRRRISVKCGMPGANGITVDELLEEENKEGDLQATKEDVEEALAYVKSATGQGRRASTFRKPMDKNIVAKVHMELLKTMEFKEAFKLYDSDNDGKANAQDIYRVMVSQGEDISYEQALELMCKVCEPGESNIDFRGFCRLMRDGEEEGGDDEHASGTNGKVADDASPAPAAAPAQ